MPGKDGYQVISEIKAAGITTPVCALTAHAMAEEIEKTKKLGFYSHITKPISKEDLVAEILSVLS
jgi:CheY-like chemotaxis protein